MADEELKAVAKNAKKKLDAVKKEMEEKGTLENYKYRLSMKKTLDFIYENAKLGKEKRITYMQNEEEE